MIGRCLLGRVGPSLSPEPSDATALIQSYGQRPRGDIKATKGAAWTGPVLGLQKEQGTLEYEELAVRGEELWVTPNLVSAELC